MEPERPWRPPLAQRGLPGRIRTASRVDLPGTTRVVGVWRTRGPESMSPVRPPAPGRAVSLPDAAATETAGRALGRALEAVLGRRRADGALIVGLAGELGAGKTTLARAVLRALGVAGMVRSPTYTIAEPYETRIGRIWHLDLYRIADPDELEFIAIRDLVSDSTACLVEWPERGRGSLPEPDCLVALAPAGPGRRLRIESRTVPGDRVESRALASMRA